MLTHGFIKLKLINEYIYFFCVYFRDLCSVLVEKYHWPKDDAESMTSFLTPMLAYYPGERATAHQCLQHSWLAS